MNETVLYLSFFTVRSRMLSSPRERRTSDGVAPDALPSQYPLSFIFN